MLLGTPIRELLEEDCGGMWRGRSLKAFQPGGGSMQVLLPEHADLPLDMDAVATAGSSLGAGAMIFMDETACLVDVSMRLVDFYEHESCGKCVPCREGTYFESQLMHRLEAGGAPLDAAAELGIHIPIYCAHPKMEPVAVCRMCLVNIEKFPKPQPACATTVAEGMVVRTDIAEVTKLREGMLEFLLLNHPLDCPVCDRSGECDLQDFTFRYGPGVSRFPITEKVHFNKAVPLSQHIELAQERCILCWRCARYYDEITGEKEIVLQQRGVQTLVATFNDQELQSAFQGNLPEICPVGALTHREYRFVSRPWDLQRTAGVCPE